MVDSRKLEPKPWYAAGIRFECQRSGCCCVTHGEYSRVYIGDHELPAILELLDLSLAAFEREFCWFEDGYRLLQFQSDACPFLVDQGCRIYAARPVQCRTWPFWRQNLRPRIWKKEIESCCPGIGKGRLFSREEIDRIAAEAAAD